MPPIFKGLTLAIALLFSISAFAQQNEVTWMDEFDPADPRAEQILEQFDKIQEQETGMPSWIQNPGMDLLMSIGGCYRESCQVFARVSKRNQKMYLSVGGVVQDVWPVSSGAPGHTTPNFDRPPNGRVYDHYTSSVYPGGDWKGLGNMPYAVFISGGYAIHGTPKGNWDKLGVRASHGCIRIHPDSARIFNRLVRHYGVANSWITVED